MNYMIKEMDKALRPRERLKQYGVASLGDDEVLAILLRTGTKDNNVKNLAMDLLKDIGGLKNFNEVSLESLAKIKGIGEVKAITLFAALEFGKRILQSGLERIAIINHKTIYDMFKYEFKGVNQEMLMALFIDAQNKLITYKTIFIGTLNKSTVHPREIFKEAVKHSSNSIVIIHNHPSGVVKPSLSDEVFTDKLIDLGKLMDIPVIDHIIIGNNKYYSFKEKREFRDDAI